MRKTILITTSAATLVFLFSISYLSIFGFKTDNFNVFINNIVKEYNPKLNIKLDDVFIKLNLSQGSININTKDSILNLPFILQLSMLRRGWPLLFHFICLENLNEESLFLAWALNHY